MEIKHKINGKEVTITIETNGVSIAIEGYETMVEKDGSILYVDILKGMYPVVYVWADKGCRGHTDRISLEAAKTTTEREPIPIEKKLTLEASVISPDREDYWFAANLAHVWADYLPGLSNVEIRDRLVANGVLRDLRYTARHEHNCLNYYFDTKECATTFLRRANKWLEDNRK